MAERSEEDRMENLIRVISLSDYVKNPEGNVFLVRDGDLWQVMGVSISGEAGVRLSIRRGDMTADVKLRKNGNQPALIQLG